MFMQTYVRSRDSIHALGDCSHEGSFVMGTTMRMAGASTKRRKERQRSGELK